ncbi:MAG: efflux RND transporter periplasmic adaptor subunit, partial [Nitrospiria bacterium]
MKKLIVSIILIAAMAGGTFFLVNNKTSNGAEESVRYKEFMIEKGTFKIVVTANGVVQPINRIEIKSKASGQIIKLPVNEGDFIQEGELIARLDQKDDASAVSLAEADLEIAKAELKQASLRFNRRKKLFNKKIISEEEKDEIGLKLAISRGKVIQAATALERAKERLDDSVVRAPISGVILQKKVEQGQIISSGVSNVSGGTSIVDIADMSRVYIEAGVDEIDIGKIQTGQLSAVTADAYPQQTFQGKIVRIAPEAKVEQNVTLFDVIVEVENRNGKLKPGMNTTMEITTLIKKAVLVIPVIAFQTDRKTDLNENERTVLVKKGEQFVPHKIAIGIQDFQKSEVLSGLSEGDIVGVPMTSRLKKSNVRLEKMIKKSRSFG